jgi:hypothetical protein
MEPEQQLKESLDKIRYEWRGFSVVDGSFEDAGISLNADRIADWWIDKFTTHTIKLLEAEIERLEESKKIYKCGACNGAKCGHTLLCRFRQDQISHLQDQIKE